MLPKIFVVTYASKLLTLYEVEYFHLVGMLVKDFVILRFDVMLAVCYSDGF